MKLCERIHWSVVICTLIAAATASAACGGPTTDSTSQGTASGTQSKAHGHRGRPGVITGTITFDGTAPTPRPLRMDSDPKCVAEPGATSELLVVGAGNGLQNVFVYVKDGLGARTYAVPTTPVTLDQKGCRYLPHVFGVQVGQPVHHLEQRFDVAQRQRRSEGQSRRSTSGSPCRCRPSRERLTSPRSWSRSAATCTAG